MRYLSLFSGIEAASAAWRPLEWEPVGFSEVDPFACAVLAARYPSVRNYGDITKINIQELTHEKIDLIVGGSPCQGFSVAGERRGLDDERSGLALAYLRIISAVRPKWFVWENVPGVLSCHGGQDFREFLRVLCESGCVCAWRVLDAQFFGVPQHRERVFLVGSFGDWRDPLKVLFERALLSGDPAPGKRAPQNPAAPAGAGADGAGRVAYGISGHILNRTGNNGGHGMGITEEHCMTLTAGDRHAVALCLNDQGGAVTNQVYEAHNQDSRYSGPLLVVPTVTQYFGTGGGNVPLKLDAYATGNGQYTNTSTLHRVVPTLNCMHDQNIVLRDLRARRLTPVECERLQGFPDGWTDIPFRNQEHAADSLRYKALGNSMAVPCMRWIGERIAMTEAEKYENDL